MSRTEDLSVFALRPATVTSRRLVNQKFQNFGSDFRAFRRSEYVRIDRKWTVNLVSALQTAWKRRKSTFLDGKTSELAPNFRFSKRLVPRSIIFTHSKTRSPTARDQREFSTVILLPTDLEVDFHEQFFRDSQTHWFSVQWLGIRMSWLLSWELTGTWFILEYNYHFRWFKSTVDAVCNSSCGNDFTVRYRYGLPNPIISYWNADETTILWACRVNPAGVIHSFFVLSRWRATILSSSEPLSMKREHARHGWPEPRDKKQWCEAVRWHQEYQTEARCGFWRSQKGVQDVLFRITKFNAAEFRVFRGHEI